jgi:hypothetical protein
MSSTFLDRSSYTFPISPIIRITLFTLYISLTAPLPFLTKISSVSISPSFLWIGIGLGAIALYGALSERVILDKDKIQVTYPNWIPQFFREKWLLHWSEIKDLKMRTTGQGGLVYYLVTKTGDRAYLLPMRVVGFARMVKIIEENTGIDTTDVRPLSQPWMYLILFICSLLLLLTDSWIIWTANSI